MFWNNGEKGISTLADYEAVRSASGRVAFLHILPFLGFLQIRFSKRSRSETIQGSDSGINTMTSSLHQTCLKIS